MEGKYTAESLKEQIKVLEIRQMEEGQLLKEQLIFTYENIKPANILKNLVKDIYSSESLKDELIGTAISVVSGFVTKKIVVGKSKNQLLKLVGLAMQLGITNFVSRKVEVLKDAAINVINRFMEDKSEKEIPEEEN